MVEGVATQQEVRTELGRRICEGNRTLQEFVSHVDEVAATKPGESATISYRHLQRLASGSVASSSVGIPLRRTLEQLLGAPIEVLLGPPVRSDRVTPLGSTALVVAVAVVEHSSDVLVVARRHTSPGAITRWQFPAGIVKPGYRSDEVAVEETLLETGAYVRCRAHLGDRIHPRTNVLCHYFACDYLWGVVENLDPAENLMVRWAAVDGLDAIIPPAEIFLPVRQELRCRIVPPG